MSPFGWMRRSDDPQSHASADKRNPLKKPADAGTKDNDSSDSDDDRPGVDDASGDKKPGKNGLKLAALDPQTRKLMEDELSHESPAERKRLMAQWSKFDPAFVRELIQNHRMDREWAENHKAGGIKLASGDNTEDANGSAAAKATSRPSDDSGRPAKGSSGSVSPWDDWDDEKTPGRPQAKSGPNKSSADVAGPIDTLPDSTKPERPLVIAPRTADGGMRRVSPAKTGGGGLQRPTEPGETPEAPTRSGPADPFADAPADGPAARKASPSVKSDARAGDDSDGLVIQPGLAAPANLLARSQRPQKASPASASEGPIGNEAVKTADASRGSDRVQPVELGAPIDIPSTSAGSATNTPSGGTKPPASAANGSGNSLSSSATSGLASVARRALGAISPKTSASQSGKAVQASNWHEELQKIVTTAAGEVSQSSVGTTDTEKLAYIEKQVQLRMLYILSGQSALAIQPIPGLDAADQEFWQQVFWGISNYFDKASIADPSDRATQAITQLRTAVQRLQAKSKLQIRNVAFCQKITNYGNYERMSRDEFTSGQQVLLYAEVENFKSEPTPDGPYRTVLKSTIEILDSRGAPVAKPITFSPAEDLCANPRRDYFNSYEFTIPQRISLGPHTLKLTIEDQISQKVATYTVNFTVK